jgi:crossover junction endodeoxyribonuclease RuvC
MLFLGIDPGKSGAIAVLGPDWVDTIKLDNTERDIWEFLTSDTRYAADDGQIPCFAMLEQVHSMPGQGVASMFKFGQSYGFLRGILIASNIPFETVTPAKWQGVLGCRSKGDKNVTKAKAQELFPSEKVTHATADALLLAEYCRRIKTGEL